MSTIPDHSIRIAADRGGTFCDVHASYPDPANPTGPPRELIVKLLSQDPAYPDAPTEGIRRVLEAVTGEKVPRGQPLPINKLASIRLSTTVATNALLERRGERHALIVTEGFRDVLLIGNQARPKIFDLNIRRPAPLYEEVVEVAERVTLVGFTSDPRAEERGVKFDEEGKVVRGYDGETPAEEIVRGLSGEAVRILRKPDPAVVKPQLQALREKGYTSLAIVFVHSYTYPEHEKLVAEWAGEAGFTHISQSAALLPVIKMVPRGASATADAYLTPVLGAYLNGFFSGFDPALRDTGRVEFMTSAGGLVPATQFSGLRSILSGPAGGVVGYARTSWAGEGEGRDKRAIIGLDVGGTSTDVSRFAGRYELVHESVTAGVGVVGAQLDINTVAAGGGSCLTFARGLFQAGPASAGAVPGPVCYRRGGPLALTDANLVLGRLVPAHFPKIFGPNEDEGPDETAARAALEKVKEEINADPSTERPYSLDEVAYGFIKVANETMCRPIRALTEARGYATGEHILAPFGGAGGQHACEIARLLGIKTVLVHRYSSVLSAYGLALAERVLERQEPSSAVYGTPETTKELAARLKRMEDEVRGELKEQGFPPERIKIERLLNMRFDGTDTALMVLGEDARVRGIGSSFDDLGENVHDEVRRLRAEGKTASVSKERANGTHSVYFEELGRVPDTPIFLLDSLHPGDEVTGPAIVIDDTQTIVLVPGATALVTSRHLVIEVE
ncbi:Hydantoinase/oxoprolinase-domain-containing protein [Schizophyllum commune]